MGCTGKAVVEAPSSRRTRDRRRACPGAHGWARQDHPPSDLSGMMTPSSHSGTRKTAGSSASPKHDARST